MWLRLTTMRCETVTPWLDSLREKALACWWKGGVSLAPTITITSVAASYCFFIGVKAATSSSVRAISCLRNDFCSGLRS